MALSPNYSWAEPDNSSLVKNGAADIRTLGNAIDTSVWNIGFGQAGKNKIINADFGINQRSFSSTTTSGNYGFDRCQLVSSGGTATYSAQTFTTGSAPVAGYESKNFVRLVTSGQSAVGDYAALRQNIESVRTFAGQTVTFSVYAKASTGTPKIGVAVDQNFGSGGSPSAQVTTSGGTATISTSWARYSFTISVPSISGKTIGTASDYLGAWLFTSVGTSISASGYPAVGIQNVTIDTWGWQIETGSVATPFQTASGGSPQAELAMCHRYFQRWSLTQFVRNGFVYADSTTNVVYVDKMPVPLRVTPTLTFTNMTANGNAVTAAAVGGYLDTNNTLYLNLTTSGVSANTVYQLYVAASQTGVIAYSSEL